MLFYQFGEAMDEKLWVILLNLYLRTCTEGSKNNLQSLYSNDTKITSKLKRT